MRSVVIVVMALFMFLACSVDMASESKGIDYQKLDDDAEERYNPSYLHLATGSVEGRDDSLRHPWPFTPESIGHTISSYQNYGGSPYFHHGIDPRVAAGTDVLASAGGKIVNIENYGGSDAYWEVAVLDDEGFLWQYHHIDKYSIPDEIKDAYENELSVPSGTKLGEVYYWSVSTFGERFHHIHLNILGEGGVYANPLMFLEPLGDDSAPVFEEVGVLKDGRKHSGAVSGQYSIYAKIHDLMLHDKFVLPVYNIEYAVDGGEFQAVWKFDGVPGGSSKTRYVYDYFVRSMTCGNYSCRELAVDLGFSRDGNISFTRESGAHSIEIIATDFYGNSTTKVFAWQVK